jgi:hypothetical protein
MRPNTNATATEPKRSRRSFLLRLSWAGLSLLLTTFLAAILRFFWPRVSNRPARSVQVGFPADYRPGQVTYHRGRKLFIVRDEKGFLCLSARCTHLGFVWWSGTGITTCFYAHAMGGNTTPRGEMWRAPHPVRWIFWPSDLMIMDF